MKAYLIRITFLLLVVGISCWAQTIVDPLHGCIIGTNCGDNGTVTPTTTNPLPNFTFTISPGPNTGDTLIAILVPNNEDSGSSSFSISGTSAGATDSTSIGPDNSSSKGDWTSGGLGAFLGLTLGNGSPKNDITAWLPYTQGNNCGSTQTSTCDPGATGFQVYLIDLGDNELQDPSNPVKPVLTLSGSNLPVASLLAGFLGNGTTFANSTDFISTANSGAIFEAGGNKSQPPPIPEPASIVLLGTVTVGVVSLLRRKHSRA